MHPLTLLTSLLLTSSLSLAAPNPEALADADVGAALTPARAARAAEDLSVGTTLEQRKACKCIKVSNPGLYCDYCQIGGKFVVTDGWTSGNVYWCNKQGGCDDLGKRNSCVNGKGPCDGRDSG
jgi:hypothetical protein